MKFPAPVPPVTAQFTAQGILLVGIQKGQMYHRVLSWKELFKLAKKGKKTKPEGFLKQAASKMDEMTAASDRAAAESARLRETLKSGGQPLPTSPMPPVMPVPPYRRVQAVPVAPPAPVVPPPSASEM